MTTDPTRAAEIVVRAEKAIALGKATGSDGSRLPSNIYVIAEELLALLQRPTDTARAVDELASYEKFDGVGPHAETIETRARIGERYLECYESALSDPRLKGYTPADCPSELLLDILHTWEPATPSPVTDETALSGEAAIAWEALIDEEAEHRAYIDNEGTSHCGEWGTAKAAEYREDVRKDFERIAHAYAALASTPQPAAAETVEQAVAAERERCAKIADWVSTACTESSNHAYPLYTQGR